jgi:HK97 family phage prohead protease
MQQKAFSAIVIKAVDEELREFSGMATTPAADRVNDVIEPSGLTFPPEVPLLLNHKHDQPVGTVRFGQRTANGLPFRAKIPKIKEAGTAKDRTDEAWHSVKHGLIKGVSIGFMPKEYEPTKDGKGVHYKKAAIHELSLTAIPCNPEAMITAFKNLREATGERSLHPNNVAAIKLITLGRDSLTPAEKAIFEDAKREVAAKRKVAVDTSLRRYS